MKAILYFINLSRSYWLSLCFGTFLGALSLIAAILLLSVSGWFITASAVFIGTSSTIGFNYLFPSALIRASALTRTLARYFERLINHNAAFKALADIRLWVYYRCIPLAPGRLGKQKAGSLLSYILEDVEQLDNLYLRVMLPVISALFSIILAFFLISLASLKIAFLFGLLFILTFTFLPYLIMKRAEKPGKSLKESHEALRNQTTDLIEGITEVKAFQREGLLLSNLLQYQENLYEKEKKLARILAFYQMTTAFISPLAFVLVFVLCILENVSPALSVLAGFAALSTFETLHPLMEAAELSGQMKAAAQSLYNLKTIEPTAKELPKTISQQVLLETQKEQHKVQKRVMSQEQLLHKKEKYTSFPSDHISDHNLYFENISFSYPDIETYVFKNLSFTLKQGERIAVMGPSGSGKTTLINLLLRFYDIQKGQIIIGDKRQNKVSINAMAQTKVRKYFSLVDQKAHMLSADIETNLRIAYPEATQEQLWESLESAYLKDFVLSLPRGLKTWIGSNGALLSGGQRRRLALARAFLKKAPILLLDEPVEGLDRNSQLQIIDALKNWYLRNPESSLLLISHQEEPLTLTEKRINLTCYR